MRKAIGPMLKIFAFMVLILSIAAGVAVKQFFQLYAIPADFHIGLYIGLGLVGLSLFLLLYARGQSVQSLVQLTELETASRATLREIASLLRDLPSQSPFESPLDPLRTQSEAPAKAPVHWRRQAIIAPEPPSSQVACSLCGHVQLAGQSACRHCGASFAKEHTT